MTAERGGAKSPATATERVAKSQQRAVERGARIVRALLPPDAASALSALQASDYGANATACISRALIEAHRRAR